MSQPSINCPIVRVPEVVPCAEAELDALVAFLESDASIEDAITFVRAEHFCPMAASICANKASGHAVVSA